MSYNTGTASTFADLKSIIESVCVANGWTLTSDILSKGTAYVKLTSATKELKVTGGLGQSGSTLTTATVYGYKLFSADSLPMTFPITYHIHTFSNPTEVYCFINYNTNYWQQLSFGVSNIPLTGSGNWVTGAYRGDASQVTGFYASSKMFSQSAYYSVGVDFSGGSNNPAAGLFHASSSNTGYLGEIQTGLNSSTSWLNHGNGDSNTGPDVICYSACNAVSVLLWMTPNVMNNAAPLIPLVAYQNTSGYLKCKILQLQNARQLRIDYLTPGEVITYGAEQWKIYPFYRKDTTARNGVAWSTGADHSGTLGFAIKYDGA